MSPDRLFAAVRAALRRLVCRVMGHVPVRAITDIKLDTIGPTGLSGVILGDRYDCRRCGRGLSRVRRRAPTGNGAHDRGRPPAPVTARETTP